MTPISDTFLGIVGSYDEFSDEAAENAKLLRRYGA